MLISATAMPVLMQASAGAIIELARDPRYVGGDRGRARRAADTVGLSAVEPAPARSLPGQRGGGISEDAATWHIRHAGSF